MINPFELHNELTSEDISNLKQWADFITPNCHTLWAEVADSIREYCSVEQWGEMWTECAGILGNTLRDTMTYIEWCHDGEYNYTAVIAAYIASQFPQVANERFIPAAKLWKRGFIPCWNGHTWSLISGDPAHIRYEISIREA